MKIFNFSLVISFLFFFSFIQAQTFEESDADDKRAVEILELSIDGGRAVNVAYKPKFGVNGLPYKATMDWLENSTHYKYVPTLFEMNNAGRIIKLEFVEEGLLYDSYMSFKRRNPADIDERVAAGAVLIASLLAKGISSITSKFPSENTSSYSYSRNCDFEIEDEGWSIGGKSIVGYEKDDHKTIWFKPEIGSKAKPNYAGISYDHTFKEFRASADFGASISKTFDTESSAIAWLVNEYKNQYCR